MSKPLETCPNNLPTQLSSFIGREHSIAELKSLLSTTRLLTLTGAGGSGKTRLALQVAGKLLAEFEHGVWWVELAALTDPVLVPQQVASSLGIPEQPGRPLMNTLSDALQTRKLLLLLDNCEHLVVACARLVETLLHSCADLRILTTSREALNIASETTWSVPSLRVPDAYHLPPMEGLVKYEAVHLFIERAASALPIFRLTQENAPALAQVCRRLDGMPLAIELAAARVRVLSVEQIATRLDDSYRLLAGGSRTALPRQQTLQATIDWSYNLLSEKEQTVFRRLSVFAGGFTLEAVEVVCAGESIEENEILDLLSHLLDKSLVQMEERSGEARYRLLETIRQYGQDKLQQIGEVALVRLRHRDWCVDLAERAEPELLSAEQGIWFDRLETEHDNLRTALRWALERGEAETVARIGASVWHFWQFRGYLSEGRRWLEVALAAFSERTALRAKALLAAGLLAFYQDDYVRANVLLEESLELSRTHSERQGIAYALNALGSLAQKTGDYERATTFYEESLPLLRELGDQRVMAFTLSGFGLAMLYQGDNERAALICGESLALSRERGDPQSIAGSLTSLAIPLLEGGDHERARTLCEESLTMRQQLGDKGGSAHTLAILGRIAMHQSDYERATTCYEKSLTLRQETGEKEGIATALEGLAAVAGVGGQPLNAARLYGSAESLRDTLGAPLTPTDRSYYEQTVAAIRAQLDEALFARAWAEGRAMTLEQAIAAAKQVKAAEHITPAKVRTHVETSSTSPSRGNPFGLTSREIDVLRLLTQGLTYAQIAEQLIISPRTADAHLRSIYGKLGVTSRSTATRYAIEHKLV